MPRVTVRLPGRDYPVLVGTNSIEQLNKLLYKHLRSGRLFLFYDARFYALHGPALRFRMNIPDKRLIEMVIPSGERAKSQATLRRVHDFLLGSGISRTDLIVACGGGVVTDLIGYAAASVLRGVRWAAVPTTLVGMVDAAIGGKTGINHMRGKNLIGAFWQPVFVYADTFFLQTLSFRQLVAGLGEVLKYCGLIGSVMTRRLAAYLAHGDLYRQKDLVSLVYLSAKYKAGIVARDERDSGPRMFLNFGHTFAHAIERALGYGRLLHGEAVILGILAALEMGAQYLPATGHPLAEYKATVEQFVTLLPRRRINISTVLNAIALDKKRLDADQKYVLLAGLGKPFIAGRVDRRLVRNALQRMLTLYEAQGGTYARHSGR